MSPRIIAWAGAVGHVIHIIQDSIKCRMVLATIFVIVAIGVTCYNLKELRDNPTLGTDYVLVRRAELVREIEGVSSPSKQEMINLTLGDGMRFFAFLREQLPQDAVLIFPSEGGYGIKPAEFFRRVGGAGFRATLYPRKLQRDTYDFERLPFDPLSLSDGIPEYRLVTQDYAHSSRQFVFQVFVSPETKRYRFFFNTYPVTGQATYHTEMLFVMYPDGPNS